MLSLLLALAAAQASGPPPRGSREQRALWERGQRQREAYEQSRLERSGFEPLHVAATQGRNVRRIAFADPYRMLPEPAMEVERHKDGSVTLTMVGERVPHPPVRLAASEWRAITSWDDTVFARAVYQPWDPSADGPPRPGVPGFCHAWSAVAGATIEGDARSGSWSGCGDNQTPASRFAAMMAGLAVRHRAGCKEREESPFWAYSACFAAAPKPLPARP